MLKTTKRWLKLVNEIHDQYDFAPVGKVIEKRNVIGLLHSETEPAYVTYHMLSYWHNGRRHGPNVCRYGTRTYFFKDVLVPPRYILEPDTLTFEEVIKHPNTEVRRVGCEIYGFNRMIEEGKFKCVEEDKNTGAILLSVKLDKNEEMKIVKVLDGTVHEGVRKEYFLQVPPRMKTCHEAIAWTFYKTPEEYHPEVET